MRAASDLRAIRGRICAIGPATRDALERFHLKVDVMAEQYVAEGLLAALAPYDLNGAPCADRSGGGGARRPAGRTRAAAARTWMWWKRIELWRRPNSRSARSEVLARQPDWITFTSSSTVQNLVDAIGLKV